MVNNADNARIINVVNQAGFLPILLTPTEILVLLTFDTYGELLQPTEALSLCLSKRDVNNVIKALKKYTYVAGKKPYFLTPIGKRVVEALKVNNPVNNEASGDSL
jgi:DNA-binding MarR family transcriptional regulator